MTDQSMIERVSVALAKADGCEDPYLTLGGDAVILWEFYRHDARAAIESMREPTRAMKDAVLEDMYDLDHGMPVEYWTAMIDTALEEEPK